jgi:uncharacterized membrane protein YdjX (TVP38/TMEM64 family)
VTSIGPQNGTGDEGTAAPPPRRPFRLRRMVPLVLLAAAVAAWFAFGGSDYLSFASLRENRAWLMQFVAERPVLSVLAYLLVYAVTVTLSIPGATVLSIAGGFLFGLAWGTVLTVAGATAGAVALFLIAKTTIGDALHARAGRWLRRMEAGFAKGAFSYLLVLRLIPLFPFFVVNLVPAFLGVPLGTYFLATVIGIIPGTFVYISIGAGLGSVFEAGEDFSPADALTPEVIVALIGLAVLALLQVAYRQFGRGRRRDDSRSRG